MSRKWRNEMKKKRKAEVSYFKINLQTCGRIKNTQFKISMAPIPIPGYPWLLVRAIPFKWNSPKCNLNLQFNSDSDNTTLEYPWNFPIPIPESQLYMFVLLYYTRLSCLLCSILHTQMGKWQCLSCRSPKQICLLIPYTGIAYKLMCTECVSSPSIQRYYLLNINTAWNTLCNANWNKRQGP